jgi:serine/threonine protein kinase
LVEGAPMIGQTVSHYRVLEKLGEGGMGVVYKALDTHLDRPVAIKVLRPEAVTSPERKRRFVQEAKAASALNHPNILHIYDIDQSGGTDFIAMEYVPGRTLDELIGRKGLGLGEALKYVVQIAGALAKAHGPLPFRTAPSQTRRCPTAHRPSCPRNPVSPRMAPA